MAVMGAKVAAVKGAAEQRKELAGFAAEDVEDGRKLLSEQEKPAIGEPPSPLSSRRSGSAVSVGSETDPGKTKTSHRALDYFGMRKIDGSDP
jgi:hypothetical protein